MNEQNNPNTNNNEMNATQNDGAKSLFDTNVANTYNNYSQNLEHLEPAKSEVVEEESPFFTPISIQPDVQENPTLPDIVEKPVEEEVTKEEVQEQPKEEEVPVKEETPEVEASPAVVAPEQDKTQNNVEVIETAAKAKASNAILIIFTILLVVFVFNIDTVLKIYNQIKDSKNPGSAINKNTNNLTDGFILIDDSTSSIKLKDIKFYNFRKAQGTGVTFSYESLANYNDVTSFEIYIELYDSEKEIFYKELFNPNQKLEKDTVRIYTMDVDNIIFNKAFYALVKIYTDTEKQEVASLTCTLTDGNYTYKNDYSFLGNGLSKYEVTKTSKKANDAALKKEYDDLEDSINATLANNTLTYSIDLNKKYDEYIELYEKDATLKFIKEKETLKEWKCE